MRIGVVHGPNLNLLGKREPEIYGTGSLAELNEQVERLAGEMGASIVAVQANGEGELVDHVQALGANVDGFLVNAAAYSHHSIALRDALLAVGKPFVEVHLTNVYAREPFRARSILADKAVGAVAGFGRISYLLGLRGLVEHLRASVKSD